MLRPVLRSPLTSLFLLMAACGDDVASTDSTTSSTGDSSTTSVDSTTTEAPTTGTPTTGTTGTSTTTDTTTTTDSSTTAVDTTTTGTTTDTTTDTDSSSGTTGGLCGNGAVDDGESCDGDDLGGQDCVMQGFDAGTLACAADCSFDLAGCVLFSCGNAVIEGNEVCDGDDLAGQDCVMQGFDGGTLVCMDNCSGFDVAGCHKCGDDVVAGPEVCDGADLAGQDCATQGFDGGTLACAADCGGFDLAACHKCGDDVIAGPELCDGADLGGADCVSEGFEGGTLACAADCGALDTAACFACGDNKIGGAEQCDGADLGGATCQSQGADFGTLGCAAGCTFDLSDCIFVVEESEPNDDTMVATATNDFSADNADGPFTEDTLIHGAITPAGDDDIYAVTNPGPGLATLRVETFGPGGPGTCANPTDTFIELRTAANVLLVSDDDSGVDWCSMISNFVLMPNETVYVRVIDLGDNAIIASYYLDIQLDPIVCGDGIPAGPNEECDDGNVADGDGCSATCTIEGPDEIEPNNTNAEADATGLVSTGDAVYTGSINPNGDVDRYRLDLAAAQIMRLETFSKLNDCVGVATDLRVYDGANTQIKADTVGTGIANCSALVFPVPAGTFYVQVEEDGNNAQIPFYALEMQTLADKGSETEPNETQAEANNNIQAGADVYVWGDHSLNADSDFYAIDVPAGASLRLEIIEGDAVTCESFNVDSRLTLLDSNGVVLVDDDDDGRGYCSLIDGTGSVPYDLGAHGLAAGTYYVQVRASTLAQGNDPEGQFRYRLAATVRKP